jgi:hypothetical protein
MRAWMKGCSALVIVTTTSASASASRTLPFPRSLQPTCGRSRSANLRASSSVRDASSIASSRRCRASIGGMGVSNAIGRPTKGPEKAVGQAHRGPNYASLGGFSRRWSRIFWITGRSGMAAMILSAPNPPAVCDGNWPRVAARLIHFIASLQTARLFLQRPLWSMQTEKLYVRPQSIGASQLSPKPTVKTERQEWRKAWARNAALAVVHRAWLSCAASRMVITVARDS